MTRFPEDYYCETCEKQIGEDSIAFCDPIASDSDSVYCSPDCRSYGVPVSSIIGLAGRIAFLVPPELKGEAARLLRVLVEEVEEAKTCYLVETGKVKL